MLQNFITRLSYFAHDFAFYLLLILISLLLFIFFFYKIYKSDLSKTKKKLFLSIFITIIILTLSFTICEAYFRYLYDQSDGLGYLKINKKWQDRHVVYNPDNYRDRQFHQEKQEGTIRIGVIGDSITFGAGIKNTENRFSNLLEKKLKDKNYNLEVYNLGVPGLDTTEEIEKYKQIEYFNFDIIVWQYFINDIQPPFKSTGTPILINNSRRAKAVEFLSNKSYFFDYLYWRLSSTHNSTIKQLRQADLKQYNNPERLESHKKEIADLLDKLRGENKKVVLIFFPSLSLLGPDYPIKHIHNEIIDHFSAHGAVTIDLYEDLKDKQYDDLRVNRFDNHPNEYVHRIAAQKLSEKVEEILKQN